VLVAENPVRKTILSGGFDREYMVYTPNNPRYEQPSGILVCLHGFNRTMADFSQEYQFSGVADSLNFLILAPQALPEQDQQVIEKAAVLGAFSSDFPSLNSVWACGLGVKAGLMLAGIYVPLLDEELNKGVDDCGFIRSIIEEERLEYGLPQENIFVFGTSMGGYMAYQFALNQGDILSGMISVAGSMGLNVKGAENQFKTPVCDFHSLTDEVVPYSGSYEKSGILVSLAQEKQKVVDFWVKNNSAGSPVVENVQYYPSSNGITVEKITYPDPIYEVIHYKINGAGHSYFFRKESGDCMDHVEETLKFIKAHTTGSQSGIRNIPVSAQHFYPNPAQNIIRFEAEEGRLIVYDLTGKEVFSQYFHAGQSDISSLKQGTYIIRVQTKKYTQTSRLIKL
jgi:poly(3-hydroxybutyrate) depolymerase